MQKQQEPVPVVRFQRLSWDPDSGAREKVLPLDPMDFWPGDDSHLGVIDRFGSITALRRKLGLHDEPSPVLIPGPAVERPGVNLNGRMLQL